MGTSALRKCLTEPFVRQVPWERAREIHRTCIFVSGEDMPDMPRHSVSNFTKGLKEANGPPNGVSVTQQIQTKYSLSSKVPQMNQGQHSFRKPPYSSVSHHAFVIFNLCKKIVLQILAVKSIADTVHYAAGMINHRFSRSAHFKSNTSKPPLMQSIVILQRHHKHSSFEMFVYMNNVAYTVHAFSLLDAHVKSSESTDVRYRRDLRIMRVLFRCIAANITFRSLYGLQ